VLQQCKKSLKLSAEIVASQWFLALLCETAQGVGQSSDDFVVISVLPADVWRFNRLAIRRLMWRNG
jgi:hypothetical protein